MNTTITSDKSSKFIVFTYNFFTPLMLYAILATQIQGFSKNPVFIIVVIFLAFWGLKIFSRDLSRKISISNDLFVVYKEKNKNMISLLSVPVAEIQSIKQTSYYKVAIEKLDGSEIILPSLSGFTFHSLLFTFPFLSLGYILKIASSINKISAKFFPEDIEAKPKNEVLINIFGILCSLFIMFFGLIGIFMIILVILSGFQIDFNIV